MVGAQDPGTSDTQSLTMLTINNLRSVTDWERIFIKYLEAFIVEVYTCFIKSKARKVSGCFMHCSTIQSSSFIRLICKAKY